MNAVAPQMAVMLTRRCNMTCGHCSVASGPQFKQEPSETELLQRIWDASAAGVRSVQLTGGEPMLRIDTVFRLLRECRQAGLQAGVTTNGFWGSNAKEARRIVRALQAAGLGLLTVSYDRYHAAHQNHEPVVNIARAAEAIGYPINVNVVRLAGDDELAEIIAPLERLESVRLRFYDVQAVGRARALPRDALRGVVEGFCNACSFPAITDDGRLAACNGPSYFMGSESPLHIGTLRDTPLPELLRRHWSDPFLDTIRTFGPARLARELEGLAGAEHFRLRGDYRGMCDLCQHISGDPKVVAALRNKLGSPEMCAQRTATWYVIQGTRQQGVLNRDYVNRTGAARVFLHAAGVSDNLWDHESEQVLGRADLDWSHLAAYLAGCGMAKPLARALQSPGLRRWAPQFFVDRLRQRAVEDAVVELIQQSAIRRLDEVLADIGESAVLLGESSAVGRSALVAGLPVARSTAALEVYAPSALHRTLRHRLAKAGFEPRGGSRHLAFQGVPVALRERLLPAFWGLPETEMLRRACPIDHAQGLRQLCVEGFILHTAFRSAAQLYARGLGTAWDILHALRGTASVDTDLLARWATSCRAPRGFWTPIRVLCHELALPLASDFLAHGPRDRRQQVLERVARRRLFDIAGGEGDLDFISRTAVMLMQQEHAAGRARYLAAALIDRRGKPSVGKARWMGQLRRAAEHWRAYRRIARRQRA